MSAVLFLISLSKYSLPSAPVFFPLLVLIFVFLRETTLTDKLTLY